MFLPIPRLLMLPVLHDLRRDRTHPQQIERIQCEYTRYGRQHRPSVLILEDALDT